MSATDPDAVFAGSVPDLYDRLLVPLIFEPYAADLAARVADLRPTQVLEVAAGTGAATRALARALPPGARLVATDLSQPMLDRARAVGAARPVEWHQADAMTLPFGDASFDAVACQFGVMFFPDVRRAFAEARRVLRPGGALLFSVWDRLEENEFAATITEALARLFPRDPPRFLARTPHGYHDPAIIARDLAAAGFEAVPLFVTVAARSRAASPDVPAVAYCQGTPLRAEIAARSGAGQDEATPACANAISAR
ncbi:MAG: class I SAM-dependent methyltransferase, partial [Anaeromyxobacteraceae bacterium]